MSSLLIGSHFSIRSARSQKGFTLIEIITALGVLAVLASIALVVINPVAQFQKAQDARRKSDLAQIQRALEAYYQDFGQYPSFTGCCQTSSPGEFPFTINTGEGDRNDAIEWGTTWAPYMDILPVDPNSSKFYVYWSDANNGFQTYRIYASLDRGDSDPDACNNGLACSSVPIPDGSSAQLTCGLSGQICSYGVTSPNVSP